jgi:hypothetical protein
MTTPVPLPQSIPPTITRVITKDVLEGTQARLLWLARKPNPANPPLEIDRIFLCDDPFVGIEIYSSARGQPFGSRTTLQIEDVRCIDEVMDLQSYEDELADREPDTGDASPRIARIISRDVLSGSDNRMDWRLGQDSPVNPGLKISRMILCDDPFVGVEIYGVGASEGHAIGIRTTLRKQDVLCVDELMGLDTWASELQQANGEDEEPDEPEEPEPDAIEPKRDTDPPKTEATATATANGVD